MVACKYYQAGSCRFGQSCRYDHINNFGRQGNEKYGENKSIVLGVAEEVLVAERGGQWPLSCFGPFKEQPGIPGFEDVSPEEVRWEMYQAQKNNTVEQTKQQFQQLCQDAIAKRNVLKNPTRETATMLEKLQKGTTTSESQTTSNNFLRSTLFSSSSSSSIFGAQPNASPFTTRNLTPTTTSLFANTTNTSPSVFGGNNFSSNQSSIFGGANNQPTFSQPNQNVFAGANTAGNIFGAPGNPTNNYATNTTFNSAAPTNLFTSSNPTPAPGIFSSTLGSSNNTNNPLFAQKSTVAFGGAPVFGNTTNFVNSGLFNKPQASVFDISTNNTTTVPYNNSIPVASNPFAPSPQSFGNNPFETGSGTTGTFQQTSTSFDINCYSSVDSLTEEEKNSFTANKFELYKIPLKPPSIELR